MGDEAKGGKTVLYVSHNMATIRNLCTRVIVLDKGKIIFDGDVEKGIGVYMNNNTSDLKTYYDFNNYERVSKELGNKASIDSINIIGKQTASFYNNEKIKMEFCFSVKEPIKNAFIDLTLKYADGSPVGYTDCKTMFKDYDIGNYKIVLEYDISNLAEGTYIAYFHLSNAGFNNELRDIDQVDKIAFEVIEDNSKRVRWQRQYWGSVRLPELVETK